MNNAITAQRSNSLPNDYWSEVIVNLEDPRPVALVDNRFKKLYEDKGITCRWLVKMLNSRGLNQISQKFLESMEITSVKDTLLKRVITYRPKSTLEHFRITKELPIHGFVKLYHEEKAINLINIYKKIPLEKPDFAELPLHSKALAIQNFLEENKSILELIEKLDLCSLSLTAVPEELELFTGLKKINLRGNDIDYISASFGKTWKNLEKCDLNHNKLVSLPDGFGNQWEKLQALWIKQNPLPPERVQEIRDAFSTKKWLVR
ncbi:MAG TPA: hypothetical protein VGP47_05600 [Parachlamydiaceae bacterium]|nr:hypothetical protein [Parachlamydiaceae bacterium]